MEITLQKGLKYYFHSYTYILLLYTVINEKKTKIKKPTGR